MPLVLNDVFRLIDSGKNTKICLFCNLRSMHITLLLDFFSFFQDCNLYDVLLLRRMNVNCITIFTVSEKKRKTKILGIVRHA